MKVEHARYLTDGTCLLIMDEDVECAACHRVTSWIAVRRGGPVLCWTCEPEFGVAGHATETPELSAQGSVPARRANAE